MRKREREHIPVAFEALLTSVQKVNKIWEMFKAGNEKYNHLDPSEMEKVEKAISER